MDIYECCVYTRIHHVHGTGKSTENFTLSVINILDGNEFSLCRPQVERSNLKSCEFCTIIMFCKQTLRFTMMGHYKMFVCKFVVINERNVRGGSY